MMGTMRAVKLALWRLARGLGAFALVKRSAWRRERLLILCYHGLSLRDEHEWNPQLFLSPQRFRERLQAIRAAGVPVLPLGEAVERLRAGELQRPSLAITFDDGFADFYRAAVPMLREFGFPATVYLTTYYVDRRLPIPNLVVPYLLWRGRNSGATLGSAVSLDSPVPAADWRRAAAGIVQAGRWAGLDADAKDRLAEKTADSLGIDYEEIKRSRVLSLMTVEEVAQVAAQPLIDVQLHTHRHRTPHDERLFRREIADNRRRIRELTGSGAEHFCYPSGRYQQQFLPWLKLEEVRTATTCDPGLAERGSDPLLLPRKTDTMFVDEVEIHAWLSGFEPLLRKLAGR